MALGDFAADDVPKVVILRFVENATAVKLRDEGEPAVAWSDVA